MTHPNDPAFLPEPRTIMRFATLGLDKDVDVQEGLTKREWFAGQALRGAIEWRDAHSRPGQFDVKLLAQDCAGIADAIIKELSNDTTQKP